MRFAFTQRKENGHASRRGGVGAAIIRDIVKQMSEDIPIWENKVYLHAPDPLRRRRADRGVPPLVPAKSDLPQRDPAAAKPRHPLFVRLRLTARSASLRLRAFARGGPRSAVLDSLASLGKTRGRAIGFYSAQ